MLGDPLEQGYGAKPFDVAMLGQGLLGLLASPSRGILIYEPFVVFAIAAAAPAIRDVAPRLRTSVTSVLSLQFRVLRMVGTGYGRQRLPFPREDIRSEILCHGLGAHAMFPRTRTALENIHKSGTRKLIVDVRDNAAGDVSEAIAAADELLTSGLITSLEGRQVQAADPRRDVERDAGHGQKLTEHHRAGEDAVLVGGEGNRIYTVHAPFICFDGGVTGEGHIRELARGKNNFVKIEDML